MQYVCVTDDVDMFQAGYQSTSTKLYLYSYSMAPRTQVQPVITGD